MNLGAHMSIAGGVDRALERGRALGCNAVQLFVKNTNQWKARALRPDEIARFKKAAGSFAPNFILAHASYLVNLASPDPPLLARSIASLLEETNGARALGIPYMVVHPGSHRGSGEKRGLARIARGVDEVLSETGRDGPQILLETTAGQGDSLGATFEQLADIIARVRANDMVGVCLDTCHVFAAGYDLRTRGTYAATLREFDRVIGLERLKAFHLNDSVRELGSRIDRHAHIGAGKIGLGAFSYLLNAPRFIERPMTLETPKGRDGSNDKRNLAVLRGLRRSTDGAR